MEIEFLKGHGTRNDFVLLPDPADRLALTPELVSAVCDRRAGIGADGILRVVPAPAGSGAEWFMDYHNADGSIGEMCGNGLRVFARYLVDAGLAAAGTWPVLTRAGLRGVQIGAAGPVTVDMGPPHFLGTEAAVGGLAGVTVSMGNPHVVVELPSRAALAALHLDQPPRVEPPLPAGQNVEFLVRTGEHAIAMRVHERGVGETQSCGTGVCAAVAVAAGAPDGATWTVGVPGGEVSVRWPDTMLLSGPARIVASGRFDPQALVEPAAAVAG